MAISFANRFNADLLEENYQRWRVDPASADSTWAVGSLGLHKHEQKALIEEAFSI